MSCKFNMKQSNYLTVYFTLIMLFFCSCTAKIPVSRQHFIDQTNHRLPLDNMPVKKALFGDLDRDGDLDLILLNDSNLTDKQLVYYVNNGRGFFTDNTLVKIPKLYTQFQEIRLIDLNEDNALDIILLGAPPNKTSGNIQRVDVELKRDYVLINKQNVFIDETSSRLPKIGNGYEEIKSADIDGDGDIDLLITGSTVPSLLFVNRGKGVFRDETLSRLPTFDRGVQEALFGDIDGDQDVDIFFAMENRKNILLINNSEGHFTNETEIMLPKIIDNARDAAIGDIDGDGDLDIAVVVDKLTSRLSKTNVITDIDKYNPFPNANIETGTFSSGWTVTDKDSWEIWSMNENIRIDQTKPLPSEGIFYAISYNPTLRESSTGSVRSVEFPIPFNAKTLSFLYTGWDGQFGARRKNFFYLKRSSDGLILKESKPPLSDVWETNVWDVSDIPGEKVYFEAVDGNSDNTYGSIGFDSLQLSNAVSENERWKRVENYILKNNGKGIFKDEDFDLPTVESSYRIDFFDADNDKDLDMFIFGIFGASILINDGFGNFRDETFARLPNADTGFGEIDYGDIDNDQDIDIVAVHVGLGRLLMNELNPKIVKENIQKLKDLIIGLSAKNFKEGKLDFLVSEIGKKGGINDLVNQAEITSLLNVKENFYGKVINKLENNFLFRSDGCIKEGRPDKNDWIIDCSAQLQFNSLVLDTVEVIKSLISPNNEKKIN